MDLLRMTDDRLASRSLVNHDPLLEPLRHRYMTLSSVSKEMAQNEGRAGGHYLKAPGTSRRYLEMLPIADYREVFGDWLSEYAWTHLGTFTFRPHVPRSRPGLAPPRFEPSQAGPPVDFAHREWLRYVRRLERSLHRPIWWFRGDEFGERLGRLHFHALIGGAMDYPPRVLADLWTAGFAKIVPYDPERGAAYYATKYVVKGLADWDVSARLVRTAGCL